MPMSPEPCLTLVPRDVPRPDVAHAIQHEFKTWPRLTLTHAQARRLWALDATTCRDLFDSLVDAGVLRQRADGAYVSRAIDAQSRAAS
jgi:hypothetical protein